jgi:hypothetical protein
MWLRNHRGAEVGKGCESQRCRRLWILFFLGDTNWLPQVAVLEHKPSVVATEIATEVATEVATELAAEVATEVATEVQPGFVVVVLGETQKEWLWWCGGVRTTNQEVCRVR